jgi:hypothetical protein
MTKKTLLLMFIFILLTQTMPLIQQLPLVFSNNTQHNNEIRIGFLDLSPFSCWIIQAFFILLALLFYGLAQYINIHKPLKKWYEIRNDMFATLLSEKVDKLNELYGFSSRIKVLKVEKSPFFLGTIHWLRPVYTYNYKQLNTDQYLSFKVIKLPFNWLNCNKIQGNCGEAYVRKKPQLAYIVDEDSYHFNLNKHQIGMIADVKGIISLPVFETANTKLHKRKIVGIIEIITDNQHLAQLWKKSKKCRDQYIGQFGNTAKCVSQFLELPA